MKLSDRLAAAQQRPADSDRQRATRSSANRQAAVRAVPPATDAPTQPAGIPAAEPTPVQWARMVPTAKAADTAPTESADATDGQAKPKVVRKTAARPSTRTRSRTKPAARPDAKIAPVATDDDAKADVTDATVDSTVDATIVEQVDEPVGDAEGGTDEPQAGPPDGEFEWVTISAIERPPAASSGNAKRPAKPARSDAAKEAVEEPGGFTDVLEPEPAAERVRYVDPLAGIKRKVHQSLLEALGPTLYDAELDEQDLAVKVRQTLQQVIESEQTLISTAERVRITNEVSDEILGHGPLEPFLRNAEVTEIMVNGADQIYVERGGQIYPVNAAFTDDNHLRRTIEKIVSRVGRRIDESSPMVDARLLDGSRVNAVLPPVALDGPMLTIRKFSADPLTVNNLVQFGTFTPATANLLAACVRGRLNILISGGTGSGKTTTLNVMSSFVPANERIVTIEDAAELQLRQEHVVRMESRLNNVEGRGEITTRELVRNSLRMRPDRIIVGEVRDGAAVDMLQAMNTGHDGSLTTLHANSPRDALSRLETMVLMAGVELPTRAIREQAASAIDLIVHQARLRDGTRRVTHITEVTGMESEVVTLQDLFLFDYSAGVDDTGRFLGTLRPTGIRPTFVQRLADAGILLPAGLFQDWA